MSQVDMRTRTRVRLVVVVSSLVALFTVFGSTTVGAADPQIPGRIGSINDGTRGFFTPGIGTGGNGGVGSISPVGFATRLGGDNRISGAGSGGAGTISQTSNVGFATRLGSGNDRGIFVPGIGTGGAGGNGVVLTGGNTLSGLGSTGVSGVSGAGGAGSVSTFRNGR